MGKSLALGMVVCLLWACSDKVERVARRTAPIKPPADLLTDFDPVRVAAFLQERGPYLTCDDRKMSQATGTARVLASFTGPESAPTARVEVRAISLGAKCRSRVEVAFNVGAEGGETVERIEMPENTHLTAAITRVGATLVVGLNTVRAEWPFRNDAGKLESYDPNTYQVHLFLRDDGTNEWRRGPVIATHASSAVRLVNLEANEDESLTAQYTFDSLHEAWFTRDVGRAAEDGVYALRFSLNGATIREIERKKLRAYSETGAMGVEQ